MRRRGNRKKFRLKPFHYTLGVIGLLHIVALAYFLKGNEKSEGSGNSSSAHQDKDQAEVTWQEIDSMVPLPEENPPAPAPETTPATETIGEVVPAVARATPVETENPNLVRTPHENSNSVPVRKATLAEGVENPLIYEAATAGEGDNSDFDFEAYDRIIQSEFHQAWDQPVGLEIPDGHNMARLYVTIGRDGSVQRFSLAHLTGIPELDSSVLAAARKVRQLTPIPDDFNGNSYKVAINFHLE